MCGRFTLTAGPQALIEGFQLEFFPDDYSPSYNIAPSQPVLSAVQTKSGRRAGYITWGLVPFWVKEPKKWKPLINARGESLTEKASFKNLLDKRRCIILADSFFEWKRAGNNKIPHRIMTVNEKPFAFAALWDRNKQENNRATCTIITTAANETVKEIHDRMPVILDNPEKIELWLNWEKYSFADAKHVINPLETEQIKYYPVSSIVNSPKNNTEECILPLSAE